MNEDQPKAIHLHDWPTPGITAEQWRVLMRPLNRTRVAKRKQGGKELSYLEAWDVKAHLTRVFGFGNWDSEVLSFNHITTREYGTAEKPMVEVIYSVHLRLSIRDSNANLLCQHSEVAVGSTSGPANMLGEHHDNAVKTAASDAIKRCAINMGTQFGLSLYDQGATHDIIKNTLVKPEGVEQSEDKATEQQIANLQSTLGATTVEEKASA